MLDLTFETDRLFVRACQIADASDLAALMTPEISDMVALWPANLTITSAETILSDYIREAEAGVIFPGVIRLKATDAVVGWMHIDMELAGTASAALSCWFGSSYQRSGFAFEVMGEAIRFAFTVLGAEVVSAGAQLSNNASLGLIAKLGLKRGEERDVWAPARQRVERCVFWHLTRTDFLQSSRVH